MKILHSDVRTRLEFPIWEDSVQVDLVDENSSLQIESDAKYAEKENSPARDDYAEE